MSRLFSIVVSATLSASLWGQTAAPDAASNSKRAVELWKELKYAPLQPVKLPHVEEVTLSDGMRVLLLENHDLPVVRGFGLVRVGNLFDPKGKVGLASVTGAAIRSGGTANKTGDQIDEQLENIAASVESGIGEDSGSISFNCLKENTAEVMAVFKDVLVHPAFRPERIEFLKEQMASGISRRNDDAAEIAGREFRNILFGVDTPYGWTMNYSDVASVTREDVLAFYQRYFFPSNIILAVQGDFHTAEMKSQLEALFSDWTVSKPAVVPFPAPKFNYQPGTYLAVKEDVTQTTFYIGQPGGERKDADYAALAVMSDILGGGFESRLFRRLRTQLGYVYGISAGWDADYGHRGDFVIQGSTRSATTVATIEGARQEVDRIRSELVTEEELEGAKETVMNSFVFNFDTPSKTINRLVFYRYFGYPEDFPFQLQKQIKSLTREDILRVAKQYIDPSKFIIVAAGNPKDFGTPLDKLGSKVTPIDLTIPPPPGGAGPVAGAMQ